MAGTMGSQLRQKRLELCNDIERLVAGFEAETGVTVDSTTVKFVEQKKDSGDLSGTETIRIVDVICSF